MPSPIRADDNNAIRTMGCWQRSRGRLKVKTENPDTHHGCRVCNIIHQWTRHGLFDRWNRVNLFFENFNRKHRIISFWPPDRKGFLKKFQKEQFIKEKINHFWHIKIQTFTKDILNNVRRQDRQGED